MKKQLILRLQTCQWETRRAADPETGLQTSGWAGLQPNQTRQSRETSGWAGIQRNQTNGGLKASGWAEVQLNRTRAAEKRPNGQEGTCAVPLVIPLMLEVDGVISSPCFYLSEFFEHRNTEYQDRLLAVSAGDAWTEWCIFFLDAVATQAKENHKKANGVYELYQTTLEFLMKTVRTDNAATVAPHLFRMAIFPASVFTREAGLNQSTAKRVVRSLKEAGVIVEILPHRGSSPAVLAFPELLKIVDGVDIAVGRS